MQEFIQVVEVSPRDGIQNEKKVLSTLKKEELISRAIDSGFKRIEVTSFVNPKKIPQMFDTDELISSLSKYKKKDVKLIGLVLNEKGFNRALASSIDVINYVVVASDTFSIRNQGASTLDNLKVLEKIYAKSNSKIEITTTIGASFGCPFEGEISSKKLLLIIEQISKIGLNEICLADTIGVATPKEIKVKLKAIKSSFPNLKQSFIVREECPILSFKSHKIYRIVSMTLSAQGVILYGVKKSRSTSEYGAISLRP